MSTVNRIASINAADKHLKNDNSEEFHEDNTELDELEGNDDGIEQEDSEDVTNKEAKANEDGDVLPKFKGKTPADISKAYAELEREHGRLANEVGDYRKMAREYLFNEQGSNKGKEKARQLTDEDFLDKPSEAVSGIVEDKISPMKAQLDKVEMSLRVAEFQRTNPDFQEIVTSPEFSQWVQASPYRTRLFKKADEADLDAGTELLQGFREMRDATKTAKAANEKSLEKEKALRKVSSEKSGSSGSSGKKKIWSSAYLVNLKITNPDKYNALQPEIMEAYREGRVK